MTGTVTFVDDPDGYRGGHPGVLHEAPCPPEVGCYKVKDPATGRWRCVRCE